MTLRDLPPVRALAEERANDLHLRLFGRPIDGERLAQWREAHLALLTDLSRPDSRDAVARLVAERVGLVCGATAPEFRRFRLSRPDGAESWAWALLGSPGEQFVFTDGNVPGISAITDPAEALARVAIAVLA